MTPDPEDVEAFVAAIEYKPDWTFETTMRAVVDARFTFEPDMLLRVAWKVPDIHTGAGHTSLVATKPLHLTTWGADWQHFVKMIVHDAIAELEAHERLEHLRLRGEPMWDAHKDGRFHTSPSR